MSCGIASVPSGDSRAYFAFISLMCPLKLEVLQGNLDDGEQVLFTVCSNSQKALLSWISDVGRTDISKGPNKVTTLADSVA